MVSSRFKMTMLVKNSLGFTFKHYDADLDDTLYTREASKKEEINGNVKKIGNLYSLGVNN